MGSVDLIVDGGDESSTETATVLQGSCSRMEAGEEGHRCSVIGDCVDVVELGGDVGRRCLFDIGDDEDNDDEVTMKLTNSDDDPCRR